MMKRAVFLDRDGVVNYDVRYVHSPELIVLKPGVAEGLKQLHDAGFLTVVVTNQGGVALGMYEVTDIKACHRRIQELLKAENGEYIDGFYFCPHHERVGGGCSCRKPNPGMFFRASRELDIDLERSFMVGDRISDLEAGRNAGCIQGFLVGSFFWEQHAPKALKAGYECHYDFGTIVAHIINYGC